MPRTIVSEFIKLCPICNLKAVQVSQARLTPIRSNDFWTRIQLDLVDMRHALCTIDGKTFNWIAHVEDHYSKFHIIWAQEHKEAEEVASGLKRHVFSFFGLPRILQCDNGKEFKNQIVRQLVLDWEGLR